MSIAGTEVLVRQQLNTHLLDYISGVNSFAAVIYPSSHTGDSTQFMWFGILGEARYWTQIQFLL